LHSCIVVGICPRFPEACAVKLRKSTLYNSDNCRMSQSSINCGEIVKKSGCRLLYSVTPASVSLLLLSRQSGLEGRTRICWCWIPKRARLDVGGAVDGRRRDGTTHIRLRVFEARQDTVRSRPCPLCRAAGRKHGLFAVCRKDEENQQNSSPFFLFFKKK
jgi:hypothetical protein